MNIYLLSLFQVPRNSQSRQKSPLDDLKLHSPCIFQNIITMCLAERNMHLFIIKNSNLSFIQRVTFYSQKDIFRHFQKYSFRK